MIDMSYIITEKKLSSLQVSGIQERIPRSIRTTWIDSIVYPNPYATQFNSSGTGTTPSIVGETGLGQTVYFQHEIGNDQINPDGTVTTLTSSLQSYDFAVQTDKGMGEYFLAMRRFLPDFKTLTGNR